MRDELLELVGAVEDARRWLDDAEMHAGNLGSDPQTGEPYPWKELDEAMGRIAKAREILQTALEPLADAIKQAREHQDHMEDLWDANRL